MEGNSINPNKSKYKIRNWQAYNKSLCRRGSLDIYLGQDVLDEWSALKQKKKEVGKQTYSNNIILCCLLVKTAYGLKFRQAQGFLCSLMRLLGLSHLPVPDYTTLNHRQSLVPIPVRERLVKGENLVVRIDSTGLKVFGEGEWKVRKHGWSKRRRWKKLHICVELFTEEILAVQLTGNEKDEAEVGTDMLRGESKRVHTFKGDGGYDKFGFRETLGADVIQVIPPLKTAVLHASPKKGEPPHLKQRNQAVRQIKQEGLDAWKKKTGYHQRSLNEVAMFRYKTIFGGNMSAHKDKNQLAEAKMKCFLLNRYAQMGMPQAYKIG